MKIKNNINKINRPTKLGKFKFKFNRKKVLRNSLKFLGGFVVFILLLFIWFAKDLPTITNINQTINTPSSQILDRNGELLYAVSGDKKRFVVPFDQIPDSVKEATISLEDKTFYTNKGIDVKGIARSVFVDVIAGEKAQGGSTITQQLVKNAVLTNNKSFTRKIKEVILAIEVTAAYPKDKILDYYLNEIPYGGTSYGIEAASRSYFGISAKDLTLAQAATLAALPQAPTYYSPYGPNVDALMKRKDFALDQMVKNKYITQDQADQAKAEKITFQSQKDSIAAPHFTFYVMQQIAKKYGEYALQNGGLKITTTLDLEAQKMAQKAVDDNVANLSKHDADNASLTAIDPKTGEILAMVGSEDYFNDKIDGQVNVATSLRQPGSSIKPIIYATAFEGKYNPAYPLFDTTTDFGGGYTPQDYDGRNRGPVSIRTALSNSLNIPAVKMLSLVGINNAIGTAQDLGISSLNDPSRYGLSLVLGGAEVKPVEMASAFSGFANEGKYNPDISILKVEQGKKTLEEYKNPPNKQVIDPQVAFLISNVMSDQEARKLEFGFTNALTIPGHQAAVKTGTTQNFHDGWTVGYTPQISTAVWAGNTDNSAMRSGSDGSIVAAPIWKEFMVSYLKDKPNVNFKQPDGIQKVTVDFLSNKLPTDQTPKDQLRSDYFASWNVPKDNDDVHITFKINKLNGKLATDQTPSELIEVKTCANVHSARPDNPAWENPVIAWARAHNLICSKPTDKDDTYSSLDSHPIVTITDPNNNTTVSGSFTVKTDTKAQYGINNVTFSVDGQVVETVTSSPYQTTINTALYTNGKHVISASITDNNGVTSQSSNSLTLTFATNSSGPVISNKTAVKNSNSTALINWTTNVPATGKVEYGTTANLGQSVTDTSYKTSHSFTLNGLTNNTTYYYKVISTDNNGNTTTSPMGTFQ